MFWKKNKRIYMDYAAATPVSKNVLRVMEPYLSENFHNPSSLYRESLKSREAIFRARTDVATILGCQSRNIIFTAGGTESNNLAIRGVLQNYKKIYPGVTPRVMISAIEHASVRDVCLHLEKKREIILDIISVDTDGFINMKQIKESLHHNTALVSIGYANSEIGVIQPLHDIAKIIRHYKKTTYGDRDVVYPLFHTDAIAAAPYLELDQKTMGVDLMSVSGAKMYGPKGIALLYMRDGITLEPLILGGGQEEGMRSGTENVPLIVGFAQSFVDASKNRDTEKERLTILQKHFFQSIKNLDIFLVNKYKFLSQAITVNGSEDNRLPNNVNVSVQKLLGEQLVLEFDARGIMVSSRSACDVGDTEGSHVIAALHNSDEHNGSVRFTFGKETIKKDIDHVVSVFQQILEKMYSTLVRFDDTL